MQKNFKIFLANLEEFIAGFFLILLIVLTSANVIIRLVSGKSLPWAEELSYASYAWVVFVGASAAFKRKGHSSIDLLVQLFPKKMEKGVAVLTTVVEMTAIAGIAYLAVNLSAAAVTKLTPILHISYTYVDLSVVFGFFMMLLHCIKQIYNIFKYEDYNSRPLYASLINIDPVQDMTDEITASQGKEGQ
ncbi:TRAP transporter small permease [Lactonifactor longoviformis]|uniref:TRAP transporter small permease n=1 Tax=Lactonifactor longoviformis TaxID=341220 RepID=UPI001D00C0E8|nr:TRAP transporter small permease [Lactonifactor longoviformis]MCB5713418.1 TRAP transporter small permease [Lactonifactor longoviformis]MCB5716720.1 TRAP transporter small permease [Lactonifactor longoviformis]